jgi:hypothetical protein
MTRRDQLRAVAVAATVAVATAFADPEGGCLGSRMSGITLSLSPIQKVDVWDRLKVDVWDRLLATARQ